MQHKGKKQQQNRPKILKCIPFLVCLALDLLLRTITRIHLLFLNFIPKILSYCCSSFFFSCLAFSSSQVGSFLVANVFANAVTKDACFVCQRKERFLGLFSPVLTKLFSMQGKKCSFMNFFYPKICTILQGFYCIQVPLIFHRLSIHHLEYPFQFETLLQDIS